MKKLLTVLVTLLLVFALAGCKGKEQEVVDYNKKSEGVMTYAEYLAAEVGTEVTIECYVQGHQSWWDNKITVYGADLDGAYFMYELTCSQEDAEKLTDGVKIKVHGYKAEYAGEIEIGSGATFEFVDDLKYVAEAEDVTALIGTDKLIDKMNKKVSFTGVVENAGDGAGFSYKSSQGDDLYFTVNVDGVDVSCCVESYLTGSDTDVYKAVEGLKAGEEITVEAYLYWWKGANPQVTSVMVSTTNYNTKSSGVMTYAEYAAAEVGTEVTIECYVQGHQSWWDNKITVYAQDLTGGYFMYEMACSQEDAAKLVPGTKIKVHGYKAEYAGEIEIGSGATFEIEDGLTYVAVAKDVTSLVGTDALINYMNQKVAITGTVKDAGDGAGFTYKSSQGDDLYFTVVVGENEVSMCVESYLTGSDTDVYKTVEGLKAGDAVTVECYLYWWKGANPHVTNVTVK